MKDLRDEVNRKKVTKRLTNESQMTRSEKVENSA